MDDDPAKDVALGGCIACVLFKHGTLHTLIAHRFRMVVVSSTQEIGTGYLAKSSLLLGSTWSHIGRSCRG